MAPRRTSSRSGADGDGCLHRLFTHHTRAQFLARYWPQRHLVCHGPLERLAPLGGLPEFSDLPALLLAFREPVRVALSDKRDEHSSVLVDAAAAEALHGSGLALILDGVERFVPEVARWLSTLRRELGLPRQCTPRSIVYVTPPGAGNSPHFDANANFVVQLHGTKRWHLEPNRHLAFPTDRWAMNQLEPSDELQGYLERPLPRRLSSAAKTVVLRPGSVLFVPRGTWHATEASGDTLALNFTFGQPTWADVVLAGLRRRLLRDEHWRQLATGLRSDEPAALLAMLGQLPAEAAQLGADEVADAVDPRVRYLLVPEAFFHLDEQPMKASVGGRQLVLKATPALRPALRWLASQHAAFSFEQLAALFPRQAGRLPALVSQLQAGGVLRRARG